MSDGPHKSLPMRRPWKTLAERAWMPAWDLEDVSAQLATALKADLKDAPIAEVAAILGRAKQPSLFAGSREARIHQLESIRRDHPGSNATSILIDCARATAVNNLKGDEALRTTLTTALQMQARSGFRQMEEHCEREGGRNAEFRARLQETHERFPYDALATELISGSATSQQPAKRAGVDEGPPL